MLLAGAASLRLPASPRAPLLLSHSPFPTFKPYPTPSFPSWFPSLTIPIDARHPNRSSVLSNPMAWRSGAEAGSGAESDDEEWLQNKPAGFGEGKTYDTMVEDELLEEMERSRKALLASINKKKTQLKSGDRVKEQDSQILSKANDVVPTGTRVRVWNLPRKKNIHRDLQLAFKGFQGILNISPAVIGNQKTRDPICKGFAFLDLESEEVANRFVQTYAKQNVIFGKVQKQIMCDIVNPHISMNYSGEQSSDNTPRFTQSKSDNLGNKTTSGSHMHHISLESTDNSLEGSSSRALDVMTEEEYTRAMNDGDHIASHPEETERGLEDLNGSIVSNHDRKQTTLKKKKIKLKSKNAPKLSISSSISQLKIRERTALTGVFSKYGGGKVDIDLPNKK
ncbi:hypothetical protein J5N97_001761 [Dioscorea zingiberensis]|uniref:RRM domain-containing protein n=1 Tax=Dioscorea zingiberensis TaxID=325984 RepID=A0A9D5BTA4_9LILI|nr:hypothetical protein J5N97_001761 [Dioscorea zingiberensis]